MSGFPWLDTLIGRSVRALGIPFSRRTAINFGSGFTVTDDPANDQTTVTTSGGGGGGSSIVVTTLAALRNYDQTTLTDGQELVVKDDPVPWQWSATTGAGFVDDSETVVRPSTILVANVGRYYRKTSAPVLSTIAALRAAVAGKHATIHVQAHSAIGDGGGQVYDLDPTDATSADNDGSIVVAGTKRYKARAFFTVNVRSFGAKGDWQALAGVSIAAGSRTVTTASAVASWIGKWITVTDASNALDADGFRRPWQGIVTSVVAGVSATVSGTNPNTGVTFPTAGATVTGGTGELFTDDAPAFKKAIAFLNAFGGGEVFVPPCNSAKYGISRCIKLPSNVLVRGAGNNSIVKQIDGGWDITVDPDTQLNADGQNFGMFNAYNVSSAQLRDLQVEGSIDTPTNAYLFSPSGFYLASAPNCSAINVTFKNFHFGAIFGSRIGPDKGALDNRGFRALACHLENVGYPGKDLSLAMGNPIEMSGHDHRVDGCTFKHCSNPINMAGDHCLQIDNTFEDCLGQMLTAGDSFSVEGQGVRGNHARMRLTHRNKCNTVVCPSLGGIVIAPPAGQGRPANVLGNMIHVEVAYRAGTFTVDAASDTLISEDHGLANDATICVQNTADWQGNALPAGLAAATKYFVINATANQFQVSLTMGGVAVNITDTGMGYHAWQTGLFTANAGTDVIATNEPHGLVNGETIALRNFGGALPAGLSRGVKYFVISATTSTFKVSLTSGGAAVDITGAGTGLHAFMDQGMLADRGLIGTSCDFANVKFGSNTVTIHVLSDIVAPHQINGHLTQGLVAQTTKLDGNTYEMFTLNGSTYTGSGIVGISGGPQNPGTWTMLLSHNHVLGWGPGSGCAAYNINANHAGGFEMVLRVLGDVYDVGVAVLGNAVSFAGHPVYLGFDSVLGGSGVTSPFALGVLANSADTSADALLFRQSGTGKMISGAIRYGHLSGSFVLPGSQVTPSFGAQALDASTGLFTGLVQIADGLFAVPGPAGVAKWSIQDWAGVSTAYTAFYVGGVTPGSANYALSGNGSSQLNWNSGSSLAGQHAFRVGGDQVFEMSRGSGGVFGGFTANAGSPEGSLTKNANYLCFDTVNHDLYIKTTDSSNTGWKLITRAA